MVPHFTKMQGLGNKFIVFKGPITLTTQKVIDYCKAYGSTQADGLLVVTPIDDHSIEMKYWNADGSVAEMCGNGLRCVTRFAVDDKMVVPGRFTVKTDAGPLQVEWDGIDSDKIEVQVGKAIIDSDPVALFGESFYKANVGNPHAVMFVDDTESAPVHELGPKVETDKSFPNKTNVEFVEIRGKHNIRVRTWERGVGETLACGTGMVAAANVAVEIKGSGFPLEVEVLGGKAKVWLDDDGYARMLGPAEVV